LINRVHIILIACWILYGVLHSVFAAVWFKKIVESLVGPRNFRYYRLCYNFFAALTLIALLGFQFSIPSTRLFDPSWPVLAFSILCGVGGLSIMASCIRKYFANLSGIDVLTDKQQTPVLEQDGLHAYVRHPLFSGTLLFVWSLFFIFPLLSNLLASVILTVYTLIGLYLKKKSLWRNSAKVIRRIRKQLPG
jgi:protein-S-isoprenylcysteine O-methyltransferase Ste14